MELRQVITELGINTFLLGKKSLAFVRGTRVGRKLQAIEATMAQSSTSRLENPLTGTSLEVYCC